MAQFIRRSIPLIFTAETQRCRLINQSALSAVLKSNRRCSSFSYDCSKSDLALNGSTVSTLLNQQIELHPDRDMVVCHKDKVRFTYQQFKKKMDEMTAGLIALGVKPGDRVGVWSPNRAEWVLTQYATAQIGAIVVNINPAYRVSELEYALEKVGVSVLVMAESFKTQDYYEMIFDLCPELTRCPPGHLKSHRLPALNTVIMMGEQRKQGTLLLEDVCSMGTADHRLEIENIAKKLNFDQPINIQFTSGTTGNPKAATLTHHNIVNNAMFVGYRLGYNKMHAVICIPVPLYHCFAMVLGSMLNAVCGSTCVYPSDSFDPMASLDAVQTERCTALYGTPTMFIDILNLPNFADYDKSSLQSGLMAGSPCPVEVMKQVVDDLNMTKACVAYGSTETSPVTFLSFPDTPLEKRCSSIGNVLDHTEAKIVDEEGHIVPRGVNGELCTRGYSTMLGYWEDKSKTDSAISPSRWYHTGDIAMMDEEGYVMINGRIKDMIIRGGENIYPVEIEQFLYTHPSIEDVQIVGLPDKRLGEEICASVKVKEGMSLTEQEVKDFCKGQISHFKIPKYVVFVEDFPLTVTRKVLKYQMREDLVKQLSLQHEAP